MFKALNLTQFKLQDVLMVNILMLMELAVLIVVDKIPWHSKSTDFVFMKSSLSIYLNTSILLLSKLKMEED